MQFEQETSSDVSYKIWWATSGSENFSSSRAVVANISSAQKQVSISLPTAKIARFRIDPTLKKRDLLKIKDLRINIGGVHTALKIYKISVS